MFPYIEGKKADGRIIFNGQEIFIEITNRDKSEMFKKGIEIIGKLSRKVGEKFKGRHAKIGILKFPNHEELDKIDQWLKNIENIKEAGLDDLAYLYLDDLDSTIREEDIIKNHVFPKSHYATFFTRGVKGTACLFIDDSMAK